MKKIYSLLFAVTATAALAETADIPTQIFHGESIHSISDNGVWMVSELDLEKSMRIRNLTTGERWQYIFDGGDFSNHWDLSRTHCVADDGTVVGEFNDIPAYWRDGKWTHLKGATGTGAAIVGAITADGSMIVGGFSDSSLSFTDRQMTYPCVWYRNDDGTYGDPVFLPNPGRDYFGLSPQYLHCTAVSRDGKTIGATMRSGQGFHHFVYQYKQDENGEWTCKFLGEDIINPTNIEVPKYPGDYNGPDYPNYELYMTSSQLAEFYAAGYDWIDEQYKKGLTEDEIALAELSFAMEFMSPDMREPYEFLLNRFLDAYVPWYYKYMDYVAFLDKLESNGGSFAYNNVNVSPDGKYIYAVASSGNGPYYMVRFNTETGETLKYTNKRGLIASCILNDNTVLAGAFGSADGMAYVISEDSTNPIEFPTYWQQIGLQKNYDWMLDNLYVNVVTAVVGNNNYEVAEKWCVGHPIATPDFKLVGFGVSTELFYPAPDEGSWVSTYFLNTGIDSSGVEAVESAEESVLSILPGGVINASADIATIAVYDLSGALVYSAAANGAGSVATGLPKGIYIVRATTTSGAPVVKKVAF